MMSKKNWGSLTPDFPDQHDIRYTVVHDHMLLFKTLRLTYSPNVERFLLGFHFPDLFSSEDFIADVEVFDEKHSHVLHPLSFSWLTKPYASSYIGYLYRTSNVENLEWRQEVLRLDIADAIDAAYACVASGNLPDAVSEFFVNELIPVMEGTVNLMERTKVALESRINVSRLTPAMRKVDAPPGEGHLQ